MQKLFSFNHQSWGWAIWLKVLVRFLSALGLISLRLCERPDPYFSSLIFEFFAFELTAYSGRHLVFFAFMLNEKCYILFEIPLNIISKGPIENNS